MNVRHIESVNPVSHELKYKFQDHVSIAWRYVMLHDHDEVIIVTVEITRLCDVTNCRSTTANMTRTL